MREGARGGREGARRAKGDGATHAPSPRPSLVARRRTRRASALPRVGQMRGHRLVDAGAIERQLRLAARRGGRLALRAAVRDCRAADGGKRERGFARARRRGTGRA